ncbi:MAG TPA: 3-deoxy-7-phosphoheptulonate synthase [Anaerolineae bacterium]|nr:3-deoxy-7-phosphoheptulonate synthase [Anaerolineae bacterium]
MIIVMRHGATSRQIANVSAQIEQLGHQVHLSAGEERTIIGVIGNGRPLERGQIELWDGVDKVVPILHPFKLASRDMKPEDTIISLNGIRIGGEHVVVMAGPCAVESREQLLGAAHAVKAAGATILRGGAYKPRSSPYSFQGLGPEGLQILAEAREQTGLLVATEVVSPEQVPLVGTYADILQIGARNMQNYALLQTVGRAHKPVLLKRGMMSTIEELLMSAEYILSQGNERVMLCERGIRTFETYTRNTLDINAIPLLKQLTHLPVIVDPSHGTGKWELVAAVSRAAIAAGADGLLVEVHEHPEQALSDGAQSLKPDRFVELMAELRRVAAAVDRTL